jgi:hypothetical protein
MPVDGMWPLLLVPLAIGIAIAYKAVRVRSVKDYPKGVAVMATQIVLVIVLLGVASYILILWVLPRVVPMGG